MSVEKKPVTTI